MANMSIPKNGICFGAQRNGWWATLEPYAKSVTAAYTVNDLIQSPETIKILEIAAEKRYSFLYIKAVLFSALDMEIIVAINYADK